MGDTPVTPNAIDVEVTVRGDLHDAAEYARRKIGDLGRFTHRPVQRAHVKLIRHCDPAVRQSVVAQANLDVGGRLVRAQVHGETAHEAIDRLQAGLRHRLERLGDQWDPQRQVRKAHNPQRHSAPVADRVQVVNRPPEERRILRRKSYAMAPCTVDEAVAEMELLGYDFHLFLEKGCNAAGVVYRGGSTGYRIAMVAPDLVDRLAPFSAQVTFSERSTPCLTLDEATERLGALGLPFLFFVDAEQGRVGVLYHRYDGHYGLITPAG